ncbi:uncharacterized protein [Blastocystis hominis]|uniref:Uncharacterized protein n=1 Tax=Blastocystis hominis TaxID=12968 RepID=D8MA29_BLAHO|nr:uncharacterized protein [Blastocystis hominis]CBK24918.2 unnamed protein product [Blastocystis hominis]|eukprot:XP_012898966.1 uncharacterized protein [Blastocystis hominis]
MQCSFVGDIPLVSTSSGTQSGLAQDFYQSKNALLLAESLFPTNSVFSGGKTKILSTDHLSNIRSVLQNLLSENEIEVDLTTYATCSRKEFVQRTFEPKLSRIFSTLTHGCRFENTYDISARSAVLFALCSCIPNSLPKACHALLETLIDFNESERESGLCLEDELFLQTTNYGQIHHLIELWKLFVSWIDEQSDSHSADSDASPLADCESDLLGSVRVLFRAAVVLLQLSGVVKKYRATLCSGLAKLFALDPACVPRFFHEITGKWPVCTSRKGVAMLELLQDLLEESEVLEESAFEGEITALLEWICKLVNGNQAEICMQGIQILDSDRVLLKYIVCKPYRVRMVEQCLNRNRRGAGGVGE